MENMLRRVIHLLAHSFIYNSSLYQRKAMTNPTYTGQVVNGSREAMWKENKDTKDKWRW